MSKNITYDHSSSFKDRMIEDLFNKHHAELLGRKMGLFERSDMAYKLALMDYLKNYARG